MQRGRFLILIGVLLAVMAVGLLLVMNRGGEGTSGKQPVEEATPIVVPTVVPPTPVPMARVIVAKQFIERGTLLITGTVPLNEYISLEEWPQSWVAQEALTSFDQVVGRIARSDLPRGTVLTQDMLTDQAGDLVRTGSDAALLIPPDRVAIAIPVDHISSVGWSLRRGDHVDVLVSFLMIDLDEEFQTPLPNQVAPLVDINAGAATEGMRVLQGTYGRIEQDPFGQPINVIPSESQQRPRLVSQVTVRDAEVLNVGPWGELFRASGQTKVSAVAPGTPETGGETTPAEGQPPDGAGAGAESAAPGAAAPVVQATTIIGEGEDLNEDEVLREYLNASVSQPLLLIVSPQDALVLKWASEQGAAIHIVLRSYADAGVRLPDTEAVTLQYMVDRFNLSLPPGLAYGVEPAVHDLERSFLKLPEKLWQQWSVQTAPDAEGPPR